MDHSWFEQHAHKLTCGRPTQSDAHHNRYFKGHIQRFSRCGISSDEVLAMVQQFTALPSANEKARPMAGQISSGGIETSLIKAHPPDSLQDGCKAASGHPMSRLEECNSGSSWLASADRQAPAGENCEAQHTQKTVSGSPRPVHGPRFHIRSTGLPSVPRNSKIGRL
jgi:hypothetical protein